MAKRWEAKDPREEFPVAFDFSSELEEVVSGTVTVELLDGVDATPESLLYGLPQFAGALMLQRVRQGVDGCSYRLTAVGSDGTDTFVRTAELPVRYDT